MAFKIVETVERGKYLLTTVPSSWEDRGILRWPRVNSEKLRRHPNALPEECWQCFNCVVKRNNIMSFKEAEIELRAMSDLSDTDQESVTRHITNKPINTKKDYNNLARNCLEKQVQIHTQPVTSFTSLGASKSLKSNHQKFTVHDTMPSKNESRMESEISEYLILSSANTNNREFETAVLPVQAYEHRGNTPEVENLNSGILITHTQREICEELGTQQDSLTNKDILETVKDVSKQLTTVEAKLDTFIANTSNNQMIISQNQEQIMHKLAEISAQFDEFIKRSLTPHVIQTEDFKNGIKIISNERSLNEFEESLKDKHTVNEMTKIYSVVCGEGKGRAVNNAYGLSDAMFDRQFLKLCSWAGGSRDETSKICFKSYKRTIDFFFKIVHASDKQFTVLECETFFKNILRNAKKRSESRQLKKSAPKRREKKKQLQSKENITPHSFTENPACINEKNLERPAEDIEHLEDKIENIEQEIIVPQETEV